MAWTQVGSLRGPQGLQGIAGPAGNDGTGVSIAGAVANQAALPTTGTKGVGYVTNDTGHLWVWTGAAYTDAGQIKGDPGATGPTGATGSTGPQGLTGAQGTPGAAGGVGPTGATGATGGAGAQGVRGASWYTGHGAPGTISGSAAGDHFLDVDSGTVYDLT